MVGFRADKKPHRKRARGFLIVAGTFAVCFLLFLGVLIWWFMQVYVPQNRRPVSSADASGPVFDEEDVVRAFLAVKGEDLYTFVLVECDPAAGQIRVTGVPEHTAVTVGGDVLPLRDVMDRWGWQKAGQALEQTLGHTVGYTLTVTRENAEKILDDAGGALEHTFSRPVQYVNRTGIRVRYEAGRRYSLSSRAVCDLLFLQDDAAAARTRAERACTFLAELINQTMRFPAVLEKKFSSLIGYTDGNVRISDYVKASAALEYLAQHNEGGLAVSALLPGSEAGYGDARLYYPNGEEGPG
ncbi:MAG: hypothetical protein IKI50_02165 [Clostridia bacterium]|nr:hypothetical protein [Clostridia bacterium]